MGCHVFGVSICRMRLANLSINPRLTTQYSNVKDSSCATKKEQIHFVFAEIGEKSSDNCTQIYYNQFSLFLYLLRFIELLKPDDSFKIRIQLIVLLDCMFESVPSQDRTEATTPARNSVTPEAG